MSPPSLAPGFSEPARDSQRVFRALMAAMAEPGKILPLPAGLNPPAPLTSELAALALTLLDFETSVWLDDPLAKAEPVLDFLRFHTSARIVGAPGEAQFALISEAAALPPLSEFACGEPDFPDRSATLLIRVARISDVPFRLSGPGLKEDRPFGADPLPPDFAERMAANRALFPLGVDLVLAAPGEIVCLPRSVVIATPDAPHVLPHVLPRVPDLEES
ncbi:MAG: phosphonate C-P lyase system protein PhnH [Pseudomonadota bacterium]